MTTRVKQDMHWWKEIAFYFILFYLIIVFGEGSQNRLELLSEIFWLFNVMLAVSLCQPVYMQRKM